MIREWCLAVAVCSSFVCFLLVRVSCLQVVKCCDDDDDDDDDDAHPPFPLFHTFFTTFFFQHAVYPVCAWASTRIHGLGCALNANARTWPGRPPLDRTLGALGRNMSLRLVSTHLNTPRATFTNRLWDSFLGVRYRGVSTQHKQDTLGNIY